ncbi:MAG: tetratricopeptide repeat protein [Chloroflexi bacterium]|nr:tetratricopeptide repeat protein [Chloroflexota bacterium]
METSLLTTKLYIPSPRPELVPRPHLIEQLNAGLERNRGFSRKLTLVSATAGFGKTTLVSEWLHHLGRPTAWLSLDKGDNDPARFFAYLIAAQNKVDKNIGQAIQSQLGTPQLPPPQILVTALINDIAATSTPFVLVLDDYQVIQNEWIHEALGFLVEHQPPTMHLVLTSRADPPLPLSRFRARGQMTEIRVRDLRFTAQEAAQFLNHTMELDLSAQAVATLEQRTEGWIAGLQMAALSLHRQPDPERFVVTFAGDDRYIADFLLEEVLRGQPDSVQAFLLRTCILDRLCAPLCNAVCFGDAKAHVDRDDSSEILEYLERSNIFLTALDNQRQWYRYHQLFADLLRQRLEASATPEEIGLLHRRASRWYEENELLVQAVEHARIIDDYDYIVHLIEKRGRLLLGLVPHNVLIRWWSMIPPNLARLYPKLCMLFAWANLATQHPAQAEECLQTLEEGLGVGMEALFTKRPKVDKLAPNLRAALIEVAIVRMGLSIDHLDAPQALHLHQQILPYLEEEDLPYLVNRPQDLRPVILYITSLAHKLNGELESAAKTFAETATSSQEQGNMHLFALAWGHLAEVQSVQGKLRAAAQSCHRGLELTRELIGPRHPVSGFLQTMLGTILYEQNDREAARHHLEQGIALAKPQGDLDALMPGLTGLAQLRASEEDWQGAFEALDDLAAFAPRQPEAVKPLVESFRAKLWAAQGAVDRAADWAQNVRLDSDVPLSAYREAELIILAQVLLAQGRHGEAVDLIDLLLPKAESGKRWGRVIDLLTCQALACEAQGQPDQAIAALARAFTLAEPEGYVCTFVDKGEPMAVLLQKAASQGIAPEYARRLLAALPRTSTPPHPIAQPLIEPLSDRELEVLRLVVAGLSNREIAEQLVITVGTTKWHINNIYGKLAVSHRGQAIARTRELGLV